MNIPKNIINKDKYKKAKTKAIKTFGSKSTAYKSMYIVREYKKMGGKYKGKKPKGGITRWSNEKWVAVIPYLGGKNIKCGATLNKKVSCRPSIRKTKKTPITIQQVIKLHGKKKVKKLATAKNKNMSKRVNWRKGTIK